MLKCITKCSKGFDRCCFNCQLKDLCKESCTKSMGDPKTCKCSVHSEEVRAKKRKSETDKRLWRIYIILFVLTLLILAASLVIIGNQNSLMVMNTDILNQQNNILLELDGIDEENGSEVNSESLGEFTITHYCSCPICCGKSDGITATGTHATEGRTIAVDPDVIPLGSEVIIDGQAYVAEDVGGAIKGNKVDIYVNSHQEAVNRGKFTREVFAN